MTTWLLDGNVLVALRLETHEHHARAHRWFAATAPAKFSTCVVTEGTLLRVHMRHAADKSAAAAWTALKEIAAHRRHVWWHADLSYRAVSSSGLTGHGQVTDAWLAALARKKRGRVATLDVAFATLHPDVVTLVPVV